MDKRIAILRGINVGGNRKILMSDLKDLFLTLGFTNVETYIQSGNIVFNSPNGLADVEIESKIEQAIFNKYGFDVPTVVRSVNQLEQAIAKNPFYKEENDIEQLHLTFLKEKPAEAKLKGIAEFNYEPDDFFIDDMHIYIFCNGKYHQSKLTNNFFESKLKVSATTRNWKTVLKLLELGK